MVARLEAENEELRMRLSELQRPNKSDATEPPTSAINRASKTPYSSTPVPRSTPLTAPSTATPETTGATKCVNCAKLSRKYRALAANFKTAKDALRRRRDERNQWIQRANNLQRALEAAEQQHGIEIWNEAEARPTRLGGAAAPPAEDGPYDLETSFISNASSLSLPELPTTMVASVANAHDANPPGQSDTTQGEPSDEIEQPPPTPALPAQDNIKIKEEPVSDPPTVVSAREIKKRKRGDGSPQTTSPRVKREPLHDDSSPIISQALALPQTQESLDLGVVQHVQTPRKRIIFDDGSRVIQKHAAAADVMDARELETISTTEEQRVLMPLSANIQKRRTFTDEEKAKVARHRAQGIASIAEDGERYERTPSAKRDNTSTGRLGSLLNTPRGPDDDAVPILRSAKRTEQDHSDLAENLGIPSKRQLPFDKVTYRPVTTPVLQATPRFVAGSKTTPGHGVTPTQPRQNRNLASKLRGKPLPELRLEDFKINPQANEGHDYAFSDVVRDKGDRACLPGCTDMHCCGQNFKALALSQRPNPPLSAQQRQEEQSLLENYLGDYSYRLATMTKEERFGAWVEAKTQELADKYGKHRHRFSRMQSPPGFWNADFPNTQELEADREEAAKRTKRLVAERHREAMRSGGRWIFKDE